MLLSFENSLNISLNRYLQHLTINLAFRLVGRHNLFLYCSDDSLHILCLVLFLHFNFQVKYFIDLTAFDFPEKTHRIHFSYNIFSLIYNFRIFINGSVTNGFLFSLSKLFLSSNWSERECWDLFGILFMNHPDLRRILTDYGFNGFPMRRDFPLVGFSELRFDSKRKSVSYFNVHLVQEFRLYKYDFRWSFYNSNYEYDSDHFFCFVDVTISSHIDFLILNDNSTSFIYDVYDAFYDIDFELLSSSDLNKLSLLKSTHFLDANSSLFGSPSGLFPFTEWTGDDNSHFSSFECILLNLEYEEKHNYSCFCFGNEEFFNQWSYYYNKGDKCK